jgi:DNA-directed RNA polymerase subunit M/transcription elongation factor TFIIS
MAEIEPAAGSLAARLDGCPNCVQNAEVPYGSFTPPNGATVALYKCTDCGHRWHTSWAAKAA